MKQKTRSLLSILLALVLLVGILPVAALAADDEFVLTNMDHLSAVSIVDVSETHEATFTVPFAYEGTVDFSSGLNISYDTAVYASASAAFPSGSEAIVDGDPISMTVTYLKIDDETLYTAQYSLQVVRAAPTAPTFTGTISKTVEIPGILAFTPEDFSALYTQNDAGALAAVSVAGSNPTFGSLKLGEEDYVFGATVSLDALQAGALTFEAATEGTVSYTVYAYTAEDSLTPIGAVILTVTASPAEEAEPEDDGGSGHFSDVGWRHRWAVQAIDSLCDAGIITGDGKGYYNPNASISRGDFVLMLCRAFNLSADSKTNFSDVEEGSYYSSAIATAKSLKIAKGAGGKFNPKASLSRQDAMVLLVRAMEAAGITLQAGEENGLAAFSDHNKISDYALDAITALVDGGIIQGNDGKLSPKSNVSRAEMAVILYRVLSQ